MNNNGSKGVYQSNTYNSSASRDPFSSNPKSKSNSIVTEVSTAANEVQIQAEYKYKLLWHYILNLLQTH